MKGSYYYLNQKKLYMAYEKGDRKNLEVWVAPAFFDRSEVEFDPSVASDWHLYPVLQWSGHLLV